MKPIALLLLAAVSLLFHGCGTGPEQRAARKVLAFPPPPAEARFYYERTLVGTGDPIKKSTETSLREKLTGESGYRGRGFAKPFDVAVYKGRVYLSDTVARKVVVLDFPGERSFDLGKDDDDGQLMKPMGIAIDGNGNAYVADNTLKTVKVYDRDGHYLRSIGNPGIWDRPVGLDVNPEGSIVYVVDIGGVRSERHRVVMIDALSGKLIRAIGIRGTEPGQFNLPRDVALGTDGLLYITDGGNFRVQVMTQQGEFVRKWGTPGRRPGQFTRAKGIAIGPEGHIYVVDAAFGNTQIFTADGQLLMHIGGRSTANAPGKYMLPAGVDVDEDGRIYMVGQFFRKVDVYRPARLAKDQGYLAGNVKKG